MRAGQVPGRIDAEVLEQWRSGEELWQGDNCRWHTGDLYNGAGMEI